MQATPWVDGPTSVNHARRKPGDQDRKRVLDQCRAEAAAWAAQPGRNLVLLFDGTGNILGNDNDTNVVQLLELLQKDDAGTVRAQGDSRPLQIVYYDPGVGTANEFPPAGLASRWAGRARRLSGLAMGSGAFPNIAEAYEFLVHNYQPNDRIFVFGFSRGAFTARALAGMVNMYGLVRSTGLPLLPAMVRTYFAPAGAASSNGAARSRFKQQVCKNFALGRQPLIHFSGVWDTVETIGAGMLGAGVSITNAPDVATKRFVHIRHALSLHETRAKYAPRRYDDPQLTAEERPLRSFDQRWFRGVHSDVGGSYQQAGLSNITLRWMVEQATQAECGLLLSTDAVLPTGAPQQALHDQLRDCPLWLWGGMQTRQRKPCDVIDPSAQPVGGAVPAETQPMSPMWRAAGVGMWLAVVVGLLIGMFGSGLRCDGLASAAIVGSIQWFTALLPANGTICTRLLVGHLVGSGWWSWACIAVAFAVVPLLMLAAIAYPMSWAVRRLARKAIDANQSLGCFATGVRAWMALPVLAVGVHNGAALWDAGDLQGFGLLLWAAAVVLLCIAAAGCCTVLLQGWWAKPPKAHQPPPRPEPATRGNAP